MSESIFQRAVVGLRDGFSRATDFLARLSFWRFVGLCFLMMITAGIFESFFVADTPRVPVVHVRKKPKVPAEAPITPLSIPSTTQTPGTPTPPVGAGDTPSSGTGKSDSAAGDLHIKINENGIDIKGSDKLAERIEKQIDAADERRATEDADIDIKIGRGRGSLPQLAFFLILLMFIIRFIANSKLRAESKAADAIEAATYATLSQQLAEAKLQAMQAQVEPHFLFNTLAAVEHLIETDPPRAAKMQRNLIGYLRSVMPNLRQRDSTLRREVEICRNYLEILKMRMEDRLDVVIDVPQGLESASLPPLILQSLVENAIQHGLEPKAEGGQIKIKAEIVDGHLAIIVADTGIGFAPKSGTSRSGVGLTNIRERLAAMFDKRGQLIITPNTPCGTQVRIELPYSVSDMPTTNT